MEAFNVYIEITRQNNSKLIFEKKMFACTGWEAMVMAEDLARNHWPYALGLKCLGWKVLNPFVAQFCN